MAVPKGRHTKSKRNNRRMHLFIKPRSLAACPKCGKPILPHTVCQECGFYKGVEYINVLESLNKKEKKQKEREMKAKETETSASKESLSWENLSKK